MDKSKQTVLVTGADRGIGRAITIDALREGFSVVAASWKPLDARAEFFVEKSPAAKLAFIKKLTRVETPSFRAVSDEGATRWEGIQTPSNSVYYRP